MPVTTTHTSAGVYTSVLDLSVTAASLSTAVVGICGMARKGPVNQIVNVLSEPDLGTTFGLKDPKYGFGLYVATPVAKQTNQLMYVRLVNGAKYAVVTMSVDDPDAAQPQFRLTNYVDANGEPVGVNSPEELGFLPDDPLNNNVVGYFILENPGEWNNEIAIQLRPYTPRGLNPYNDRRLYNTKLFYIDVFQNYLTGSAPVNTIACCLNLYQDDLNRQYEITAALENESADLRFIKNEYFIRDHDPDFFVTGFCYCQGGSDGEKVTEDQMAQAYLDYFSDPEEVRVTLLLAGGIEGHIVHRAIQQACAQHINCFGILYAPKDQQTVMRFIRYRNETLNLNANNVALYSPDVRVFDEDTSRYLEYSGAGEVCAVYCWTDNNRGSWFAPAGINNSRVMKIVGLTQKYRQEDRDAMTREQLNYIRKLPVQSGGGYAVWEANTLLRQSSAFQQIQIQRLVGYILEVTALATRVAVFDPNDDITREWVKAQAERICQEVKLARGLRGGNSGSSGYQIVCDMTNNTNATIANGDLICDLILDPTRAAKRIIYRFTLNPKGSRSTQL